jgi:anaerobic magnesium-protoporphyrin IX monomethyl ester cyclase
VKVLMAYPNLPLMMVPAISVALFNAIAKQEGVDFKLFETTEYSEEYKNRHIQMAKLGANRGAGKLGEGDEDYFFIKPPHKIIPDFIKIVEEYQPDLILVHMQEDVVQIGLQMLESIKDKNIPHICGGVYAISVPEELIAEPLVKCICRYEGEEIVRQAYRAIKTNKPLSTIDGIWYKDDDGIVHKNKPVPLVDIEKIIPDYSCYEEKRWQKAMGGRHFNKSIGFETYRGCPYQCTFCNSPGTRDISKDLGLGNFMRTKSAGVIEKELLSYMDSGYTPDVVSFIDDSFLARPAKEILEFCEMWSKYKIPFWFNTRIENCKPEYLKALKKAGVYRMTFGIESGNEEYRKVHLRRKVKDEKYDEYLQYINDSNIPYSLNVIIGMPFETREMVMDTAMLLHKARGYDGLTLSIWQPYKGTELRTKAIKAGFLSEDAFNSGGLLDLSVGSPIKMPKPYLQKDEIDSLMKTFTLYAFHDKAMWPVIRRAESDEKLYNILMEEYKEEFYFGDYQAGGSEKIDKLQKHCVKHDISTTYQWEVMAV